MADETTPAAPAAQYYMVEETDTEANRVTAYATAEELAAALRRLTAAARGGFACRVHLFRGDRLYMTKGRQRYLVGEGVRLPLFDTPAEDVLDLEGVIAPDLADNLLTLDELVRPAGDEDESDTGGAPRAGAGSGLGDEEWG